MGLGRWTSLGCALVCAGCLVGIYGTVSHSSAAAASGPALDKPILVVAKPAPQAAPKDTGDGAGLLPLEARVEGADDQDGIEPRSVVAAGPALDGSPAEGWMRRLNVARELLRQGAEQSARQTLERIIGEAQVCRAYQYALIDLAAVELYRGRTESARQLLDEARRSDAVLPLDRITSDRINNLRADLVVLTASAADATPF